MPMSNRNAQSKTDNGLVLEFGSAVLKSLPMLDETAMKHWIARQGKNGQLAKVLRTALIGEGEELDVRLQEQLRFYSEVFGLDVDVTGLKLPSEREGFGWLLLVPAGMTLNIAWAKCRERFKSCYSYMGDDLDKAVPTNERDPAKLGTYAIRFRDRVEADEEWRDTSANNITTKKIATITLLERILLELWYHWKTGGKHLDIMNGTLCSGSRCSDGSVPDVSMGGGYFYVSWGSPDCSDGRLRPREAAVS